MSVGDGVNLWIGKVLADFAMVGGMLTIFGILWGLLLVRMRWLDWRRKRRAVNEGESRNGG